VPPEAASTEEWTRERAGSVRGAIVDEGGGEEPQKYSRSYFPPCDRPKPLIVNPLHTGSLP
jgi:hypothetical protein